MYVKDSREASILARLFRELKRRNVFRIGGTYMVATWVIIQLTALAVPALHLPTWVNSLVFLMLFIGFPIALLGAWAFEITPEGMRRTVDLDRADPGASGQLRGFDWGMLLAMVVIVAVLGYQGYTSIFTQSRNTGEVPDLALAVMPFTNLSAETEGSRLGLAMRDTLERRLAEVPTLKVVGSVHSDQTITDALVFDDLGADIPIDYIVEGAVQQVGDRARISVQVLDPATGERLYDDIIDHTLTDPLNGQDDIAAIIVRDLRHALVVNRFAQMPTELGQEESVVSARVAYRRGLKELEDYDAQGYQRDRVYFENAIAMDPDFADSYFALATTYLDELTMQMALSELPGFDGLAVAEQLAAKGTAIDPVHRDARAVQGAIELFRGNIDSALELLDEALRRSPNHPRAHYWRFLAKQNRGGDSALADLDQAFLITPDFLPVALAMSEHLAQLGEFGRTSGLVARLENEFPSNPHMLASAAQDLAMQGRQEAAVRLLIPPVTASDHALLRTRLGHHMMALGAYDPASELMGLDAYWARLGAGDTEVARKMASERLLNEPGNVRALLDLAEIDLLTGRPDSAMQLLDGLLANKGIQTPPHLSRAAWLEARVIRAVAGMAAGQDTDPEEIQALLDAIAADDVRQCGFKAYQSARLHTLLGQYEKAIRSLERAAETGFDRIFVWSMDPALADLQVNEAYLKLAAVQEKRMNAQRQNLQSEGLL